MEITQKQKFDPISDAIFDFVIDDNHDGFLDQNDLSVFLDISEGPLTEYLLEELIVRLDTDEDGKISRAEFATVGSIIALQNLITEILDEM